MAGDFGYKKILSSEAGVTKVELSNGAIETFTGDRAFRNNNPGNLTGSTKGALARGALGVDYSGNYIFPSMQSGFNAMRKFVITDNQNKTVLEHIRIYAPAGADNDIKNTNWTYPQYLRDRGFDLDQRIGDMSASEQERLLEVMIRKESGEADKILDQINIKDRVGIPGVERALVEEEGEDDVNSNLDQQTAGTTESRADKTTGSTTVGFKDPQGAFPRQDYYNQATTNKAARGEWEPKLRMGGGSFKGGSLFPVDANPQYPYNKVTETSSGHRIELDDTPGEERVSVVHSVGSGMEFHADGMVVLNSYDKTIQVVGDDFTVYVRGNGDITYEGDVKMHVTGDYKVKVDKNFILEVGGKYLQTIGQGKTEVVEADKKTTVLGHMSETITKSTTRLSLDGQNLITKGNLNLWTDGDAEYGTSGSTHMSAETEIDIATKNFNMTSEYMALIAPEGFVGGESVNYVGDNYKGNVFDGQYFTGFSKEAGAALTAVTAGTAALGPALFTVPTGGALAVTSLIGATLGMVGDTHNRSNKGILNVDVDIDNKILENVDMREMNTLGENTSKKSQPSNFNLVA